jgi:hypothetical protein
MGVRPKRVILTSVACPTIHAPTPIETITPSKSSSTQSLIPSTPAAQSQLATDNRLSPFRGHPVSEFSSKENQKREAARVSIK